MYNVIWNSLHVLHNVGIRGTTYYKRKGFVNQETLSEEAIEVMRKLKSVFNPNNLANPKKIFPMRRGCGEMSIDPENNRSKTTAHEKDPEFVQF